jgi:hypothetical protein
MLSPQLHNDAPELFTNLGRRLFEPRIFDCLHRGDRIDRSDLDGAVSELLHDHVARKHGADLVLQDERFVSQLRIAGAEDPVPLEYHADLFVQRLLHIDVGEDAEAFRF